MLTNLLDGATWLLFSFEDGFSAFKTVAIWLTALMIIAFAVLFFVLKDQKRKKFLKISFITAVSYATVLAITFLAFDFVENYKDDALITILYLPITILILAIAVSAILLFVKNTKLNQLISLVITTLAFIATLVSIGIHFSRGDGAGMNGITNEQVNSIALYGSAIFTIIFVVIVAIFFDKGVKGFNTKAIAYAGVTIAMSFALSYLKIVEMPQRGTITIASLLPLMLYSYMFGTKKGVLAGMVYGLLQAVQDPYIIHPAQFLLDYPVAFSCIGLAGLFATTKMPAQIKFALGAIIAGLGRFVMHFLSGVFAFSAFAGDQNPYLYSFIYQAGYVLPDIAIVVAAGILVFTSKAFNKLVVDNSQLNFNTENTQTA